MTYVAFVCKRAISRLFFYILVRSAFCSIILPQSRFKLESSDVGINHSGNCAETTALSCASLIPALLSVVERHLGGFQINKLHKTLVNVKYCRKDQFSSILRRFLSLDINRAFLSSGQSYKHFTLVNYDSRVVIWGIFQSGTTLES